LSIRAAVERVGADVVHVHNLPDSRVVRDLASRTPLVFSAHGYAGCSPNTHYFAPGKECDRPHGPGCVAHMLLRGCLHAKDPRPIRSYYRATSMRVQAMRAADATIAHSRRVLRHLERNGIARRHVVPLFVPEPALVAAPNRGRRVLFVGRVVQAKGLDVLIRALAGTSAELEVCGDGWALPRARKLARRLGLERRVSFSGWRSAAELEHAYARADLVAVPSRWPEPFGLVGLEALSRERAVVASDTGGVRDWLDDGETGRLVAAGDPDALGRAMRPLLDDPDARAAMGRLGAARVAARFSEDRHVAALEAVYAGAIAHRRASPTITA
jgi:glycosyltransferase involved in cell wall biosynthesis